MRLALGSLLLASIALACGKLESPTSPAQLCETPAPLLGEAYRASPGADPDEYVVLFKLGYSAETETRRLAAKYRFTPTTVFSLAPGFAAILASHTVQALRCESSVQQIEYSRTNIPPP